MSDKLIKKLNDRISSNNTAVGFIEAEIPKYEEIIGEFIEIAIPIENKIISVTSSINSLKQQIVSVATSAFNVGCGTTVGIATIYPDTVKTHSENVNSSSYDGLDPFGGKTSSVLSSSNVGFGKLLVLTNNDSSQAGLGTIYGLIGSCFSLSCNATVCLDYNSQILNLQSQIVTLRDQLPSEISKVNNVRNEKKNSEIERYGQKRGVASLKQRNSEMKFAISAIGAISPTTVNTPTIVNDASLKLYYDADNNVNIVEPGISGQWKDLTGRGFDGTLTNVSYTSTISPQFMDFNGVDSNIITSSGIDLYDTSTGTEISVEVWVNPDSNTSADGDTTQRILGGGGPGYNSMDYDLNLESAGANVVNARARVGTLGPIAFSLSIKQWHHLVLTYTSQNRIRIYANGLEKNWFEYNGGIGPTIPKNGVVKLGLLLGAGTDALDGKIGETRIYNRALTPAEIIQNYNATKARYE